MKTVFVRPELTDKEMDEVVARISEQLLKKETVTIFCVFSGLQLENMDDLGPSTLNKALSKIGKYQLKKNIYKSGRQYCVVIMPES